MWLLLILPFYPATMAFYIFPKESVNLYLHSLLLKEKVTTMRILKIKIRVLAASNNHRGQGSQAAS